MTAAAEKKLEAILRQVELSISNLDGYVNDNIVNVEEAEVELALLREQYKTAVKLIDNFIDLLQEAGEDDRAEVQLHRKADLIRSMAFTERYCAQQLATPAEDDKEDKRGTRVTKLPKRELTKYDGNVRQWMSFWGAFEEIHLDKRLTESEKLHYLLQSTKEGSPAHKLVSSFPQTGANYHSVIDRLHERFGRKKTLIKVYMRDLLKLVVDNSRQDEDIDFVDLVTNIDSQIRNLAQLGVTRDTFGVLLYAVVESCLPAKVLDSYLRTPGFKEELDDLMNFLQNEVRRRIDTDLAKTQFLEEEESTAKSRSAKKSPKQQAAKNKVKSTTGFLNAAGQKEKPSCVFCERSNHTAVECRTAAKWDLRKRKDALKERNACYKCFKTGHAVNKCHSKMCCVLCGKGHHVLMCFGSEKSEKSKPPAPDDNTREFKAKVDIEKAGSTTAMSNIQRNQVLLQTLTVWIHGPGGGRKVRAAYDSLSQSSYIKEDIAKKLQLPIVGYETVVHQTFGGVESEPQRHPIYNMQISGVSENKKYNYDICGIPKISGNIERLPRGKYLEECARKGIHLTDLNSITEELEVLIGADFGDELKVGGEFIKLDSGPVAVHTKIGWVLSGKLQTVRNKKNTLSMMYLNEKLNDQDVSTLWALESIGIHDPAETKSREELEKSALEHFEKTVSQDETGRYTVHLPFLEGHPPLPSNKSVALKRLHTTTEKLKQQGQVENYDEVLRSWEQDGIIEEVPPTNEECHYLPHRAVFKENSTTPLRPVFDASARTKNSPSLNSCLEKGQNLLELIPSILTRFRMDEIGVLADVKKAFCQIKMNEQDCDKMRFLWWSDVPNCKKIKEYRHTRVAFGVSASPFLLGATLQHHINKFPDYEETREQLKKSLYVDNAVLSLPSIDAAHKFQQESREILSSGQFDLRGWEFGPSEEQKELNVLGLVWSTDVDTLQLHTQKILSQVGAAATKRNLYRHINMLYDPLGFAAPFTVVGKILLKRVCQSEKKGWDDELSNEHAVEFERWRQQFAEIEKLQLPRYVRAKREDAELTLHCCCDASRDCFATCVFLRVQEWEEVQVFLLQAKTRVSPKTGVTIPRLELLSCLIGARLVKSVLKDMEMDIPVKYWSDSTTALTWIKKEDSWATFVANRVRQIRELSNPDDWGYVPGVVNPADLPSRGCTMKKLIESRWWNGPEWMRSESQQPLEDVPAPDENEIYKEKKKSVITAVNTNVSQNRYLEECFLRCSSVPQLLRMVAYMLRFISKMKKEPNTPTGQITIREYTLAEKYIIRYIQSSMKIEESKKLPLIKDNFGILRLKTRLGYREDEECFKYPALLPAKHHLVKMLILHEHQLMCHAGVQYVQAQLREKYWIPKSRRTIRNVVHKCVVCRRHLARRCTVAQAPLPLDRVKTTKAFSVTGVDVAGPLFAEKGKKVWVVLFTCGVYRAVHLELVDSLSTEAFLGAFAKFVARRGRPETVYSDNGRNFIGASNLLRSVKWEDVLKYATVRKIAWRFNPPTAAWWGGWWERLIGMMKQIMRRVIGSRFIKRQQLEILLAEVETIMKNRPLTYISDDPEDLRPLTPACFLTDLAVAVLPELEIADGKGLRVNLKKVQRVKQELRDRFRREYLGQLVHRGRGGSSKPLNPRDVVLVELENHKRVEWPMGIIEEILPGQDGITRVCRVKTKMGSIMRPLQRLFPLEVKTAPVPNPEDGEEQDKVAEQEESDSEGDP